MIYCIVENGIIVNMIVCDSDEIAAELGALPSYDGARIGDSYTLSPAPEPEKTYTSEDLFAALLGLEVPGNAGGGRLEHLEPQAVRSAALFLADGRVALLRLGVGA